jgi:predicted amidohydrolase YtcJ
MVVLAEDIMTVPAKRIEQMNVMMTMVGGKVVSEHASFRAAPAQAAPAVRMADVVMFGGKIVTVDARFSTAEGVAIAGGRFVKVGTNAEVRAVAGPATRLVDLKGRTVVPGFIDTHPHAVGRGQREAPKVSVIGLTSVRAITQRIAEAVNVTPAGEWIVTSPIGEPPDHFNLPESLAEKRWHTFYACAGFLDSGRAATIRDTRTSRTV